ncbi:MAG: PD-(D/E)XK nuclease family protein [Acidobacteriota bacterium]
MSTIENTFSWSKSRDEVFRECLRKYYFHYYGYWSGWDASASARARQIYLLKQLKSRHMWAGGRVHTCVKDILQAVRSRRRLPTADEAAKNMLARMRQDYRESRDRKYREDPKGFCGLFEHEYEITLPDEAWKETAANAEACVRNFYQSDAFSMVQSLPPAGWLDLEKLSSFRLDGVTVWVQLDLAFRDGEQILIYDWKTGSSESGENELQLACYIFYAVETWKTAPEQVTAVALYLADNQATPRQMTQADLESMREYIRDSIDEMRFPLLDPEKNIAEEDAFDFAEDEEPCRRCNYRKVCPRWA